jgi:hypothetical protein
MRVIIPSCFLDVFHVKRGEKMRTENIKKRLEAVEQKREEPVTIVCSFPSRADSCSYYLSGGMEKEEPVVSGRLKINLHWSGKPPISDAFKIRCLRQYTPTQIDEFRREWEASTYERDKVALRELVRLLAEPSELSLGKQTYPLQALP